jgi:exodeoxyribonuclease V beta subunit
MTPFDLLRDGLPNGVRVIEASAGTGKTYTLAGLVLRLVAEEGLPIDQILIVTYTNAATAELRDRVWKRLRSALDALESGTATDPLEKRLLFRAGIEVHADAIFFPPSSSPVVPPTKTDEDDVRKTEENIATQLPETDPLAPSEGESQGEETAHSAIIEDKSAEVGTNELPSSDTELPAGIPVDSDASRSATQDFEPALPVQPVDPFADLVADPVFRTVATQRLLDALTLFDEAAIFTIHGFCQRVLTDRAFEAERLFDTELSADQQSMVATIAADFWRKHLAEVDPTLVASGLHEFIAPHVLGGLARTFLPHAHCEIVPTPNTARLEELPHLVHTAFDAVAACWASDRDAVLGLFGGGKANPYFKLELSAESAPDTIATAFDLLFRERAWSHDAFVWLDRLHSEHIQDELNQRKKAQFPSIPLFGLLTAWLDLREEFGLLLGSQFLTGLRGELERHNSLNKTQSFDDLLRQVAEALRRHGGPALTANLRQRHRAALIDEFQDTDPLQWSIFHEVFGRSPHHRLYLIGDPKQAIYGFRGADVTTYLEARRVAGDESHTLATNWRSERGFVEAVNHLYRGHGHPFCLPGIAYQPVHAGGDADRTPLIDDQPGRAPLEIWALPSEDDRPLGSGAARERAAGAVVAEILRLLRCNEVRLGSEPVRPQDIAVLVRTNHEAIDLQNRLRAELVPSVLQAARSVFESAEAESLHQLLLALEAPHDTRRLRAMLTRSEGGFTLAELLRLDSDEAFASATIDRFAALGRAWVERGIAVMFRQWLQQERVRERLMRLPDGERRVTNLLHLGELLQTAEQEGRRGSGLIQWLAEQRASDRPPAETEEMRLESDESAVKLVTIHKSKGLEYPIVLCPFLWTTVESGRRNRSGLAVVSRPGQPPLLDLHGLDQADLRATLDHAALAEQLRLLYVAITRAKHRCTVFWGDIRGSDTSALAWLLFGRKLVGDEKALPSLRAETGRLGPRQRFAVIRQLAASSAGRIALREDWPELREVLGRIRDIQAAAETPPEPAQRRDRRGRGRGRRRRDEETDQSQLALSAAGISKPSGPVALTRPSLPDLRDIKPWRIYSYSRLTLGAAEELPDRDEVAPEVHVGLDEIGTPVVASPAVSDPFLDFPRGTGAGTCLHELIEKIDFAAKPKTWDETIRKTLERHLPDRGPWQAPVGTMLQRLAKAPLRHSDGVFSLLEVKAASRRSELEFFLPGGEIAREPLAKAFAHHAKSVPVPGWHRRVQDLAFEPGGGFLQGFIDAIVEHEGRWFILDWKSNWLGSTPADYGPEALADAMGSHFYVLQYHLYAVALLRHLRVRLPDFDPAHHWGGVFYVFLRGLHETTPGGGIYHDRPRPSLLADIEKALLK